MNTAAENAGWVLSKIGSLLTSFAIVGFGVLVVMMLSIWLNIGLLGTSILLLFIGLIVSVAGYRLEHKLWIPRSWFNKGDKNE